MLRGDSAHKRKRTIKREAFGGVAYARPVNAARPGKRRRMAPRQAKLISGSASLSIQFGAVFEDVPKPGKDRLVGASGGLVDALPVARARSPRKATDETGGE